MFEKRMGKGRSESKIPSQAGMREFSTHSGIQKSSLLRILKKRLFGECTLERFHFDGKVFLTRLES